MNSHFFKSNRNRLNSVRPGSVIVLTAYSSMQRSGDMAFRFEQEANFWWLTGIIEPDWQIIIDGPANKTYLVSPELDEVHQTFDGSLQSAEAIRISGVDKVIDRDQAASLLRQLAKKHTIVYTLDEHPHKKHFNFIENPAPKQLHKTLERTFHDVHDCRRELSKLRAVKQPLEINAIRQAIKVTSQAYKVVKSQLGDLQYEYEVEALFDYEFRRRGFGHAYDPIVAYGKNACTLHYVKNETKMKKRQLLLLDVGARVDDYAADISRTYSVGEPTKRQQQVHAAAQSAHHRIISLLKPGLALEEYMQETDRIMRETLHSIGILKSDNDYRKYFPHAISHGLGVDVHDSLGGAEHFEPGMVLTVEPGIYIPEEGIGIRIEDDILITEKGHENLSRHLSTAL